MIAFFVLSIICFSVTAFLIHLYLGLIFFGIICAALAWASNECRKDAIKAEESAKATGKESA
jgi:hypothetical protein